MSDQTADSPIEGSNPDLEAERPEWLKPNFESVEAQAKAYFEAEGLMTKATQEAARAKQEAAAERAAREALEAQQYEAQQAREAQVHQNDLVTRYEQAVEMGDYATQLAIQAHVAQQAALQAAQQVKPQQPGLPAEFVADYASQALGRQYDDWSQYQERAAAWLAQNPYLVTDEVASNPQLLAQRLDIAYKAVKADDLLSGKIPQQSPDTTAAKLAAQSMSGAGVRQPSTSENDEWAKAIAEANKNLGGFSTL